MDRQHQDHQVDGVVLAQLNATVERLRASGAALIERAERAEAACLDLQAVLEYTLSLVLCDEETRRGALAEIAFRMTGDPLLEPTSQASPKFAEAGWRPVVVAGGRPRER
ncbi:MULTISPECIES: hypothetical protein [Caulobacter]|nr:MULTISPECIES: hypothetical protein [Caulobacter]MBI1684253.1 hypothetical protein [Caulobacter hibisci]